MPTFVLIPINFKTGTIEVDFSAVSTERVCRTRGRSSASPTASTARRVSRRSICARSTAARKILPPRGTSARSSTSPIRDWKFGRLRREYSDGRYEAGADIADDDGSRSSSTSTTRASRVSTNGKEELALTDSKAAPEAGGIGSLGGPRYRGVLCQLAHYASLKKPSAVSAPISK